MKGLRRPFPAGVWLLWLLCLAPLAVQASPATLRVGPARMPAGAAAPAAEAPPLVLAAALAQAPLHRLPAASVAAIDQLKALHAWNAAAKLPFRNGFARPLQGPTAPMSVDLTPGGRTGAATAPPAATAPAPYAGGLLAVAGTGPAGGETVWGTHVRVDDAYRLRLHLTGVRLPAGTRMRVAGAGTAAREFGLELRSAAGDLWTPSVPGPSLLFEVHVPAGAGEARFTVGEILELVSGAAAGPAGAARPQALPSCLVDASCIGSDTLAGIDDYRHGIAQLYFIDVGGIGSICTGSLLNDTRGDFEPYLLTANHCFADTTAAASLEAVFDYVTTGCNGSAPDETTLPAVNGSTLLATSTASDFTLVRLGHLPPNRYFFAWNADPNALPGNTPLFRLSHPGFDPPDVPTSVVLPQTFSQSLLKTGDGVPVCLPDRPRPNFIYAKMVRGATYGGSSGAPLLLASGEVVGQLGGGCGPDPNNGCNYANSEFDGAFFVTYPAIQQWLDPAAPSGPCVPSATTLCIDQAPGDRRFQVQVTYDTTQSGGRSGAANAVALSTVGITEGGLFSFFDAANPEMLVKVIDACALDSKFWVFYAATTNVGFTVTVIDTMTGHPRSYTNSDLQAAAPVQDTAALPCP